MRRCIKTILATKWTLFLVILCHQSALTALLVMTRRKRSVARILHLHLQCLQNGPQCEVPLAASSNVNICCIAIDSTHELLHKKDNGFRWCDNTAFIADLFAPTITDSAPCDPATLECLAEGEVRCSSSAAVATVAAAANAVIPAPPATIIVTILRSTVVTDIVSVEVGGKSYDRGRRGYKKVNTLLRESSSTRPFSGGP
eukprot:gnl/MRDRNA2_/MRDRNA2_85089_c0_seq2.p1 gnl/MRDRNA2_/MRDRNA2_85089_c0~~gnl/MRDRNA2_/MRDRNA2_85089_c0_seq2.p1  ORF type:complete len:200 (+),score=16.77 gnl/MRDRNA2_/MRDRNA2_85089_c0_seq2:496-1095(+)